MKKTRSSSTIATLIPWIATAFTLVGLFLSTNRAIFSIIPLVVLLIFATSLHWIAIKGNLSGKAPVYFCLLLGMIVLLSGGLALKVNHNIKKMTIAGGITKEFGMELALSGVASDCVRNVAKEHMNKMRSERLLYFLISILSSSQYVFIYRQYGEVGVNS